MGGYRRKGVLYEGPTLKRGRKSKKTLVAVSTPATVSKTVKQAINKAITRNEETKIAVLEVFKQQAVPGAGLNAAAGLGLYTSGAAGGPPSSILPNVSQGVGDADRVGALIRPKRLIVKFIIRALDTTAGVGTNPFRGVPMFARLIIYNKRYSIEDTTNDNILDKGNSTGNIDNSPDSWLERYNNRDFKILYSKTFKMAALTDKSVTPAVIENMPNGFSNLAYGRISLKCPKQLIYNTTNVKASNFAPKLAVCMCNTDGTIVNTNQFRLMCNVETQLYFTDA